MTVNLRRAAPRDLPKITEVFLACWRDSYASVMPDTLVAAMTEDRASALWTKALTGPATVLVADDDGQLLGMTRYEWQRNRLEAEVHSLYVAPWAQRRGVGGRLLRAATNRRDRATLWVFADNAPSIAFYRAQGWRPDGQWRVQPEFGQREIRMVKVGTR